jgi:hypothetical protein
VSGHAIFLNGPIGVGKTSLGRALAAELGGEFVDTDDHADPDKPWYASIRKTSESIVRAGLGILQTWPVVVVASPLGRTTWLYHRRKFGDAGVTTLFITLRATFEHIVDPSRGRCFSADEQARIQVMIAEGYSARAFNDLILDTDRTNFAETLAALTFEARRLIGDG